MVARRYGIYLRVFTSISHSFTALTRSISMWTLEDKFHISKRPCITLFRRFWRFSEDFRPLSEDFQRFSKIVPKARQTSPNIFPEFLKIPEDVRRLPKTFDEDRKMFRWYTNEFKYNLRDKLDISEIIDIFTCEDVVSLLSICYHSVYHWLLYNKYSFLIDAVLEVAILLSWRHSAITGHAGKIERAS